jgi:hypothetical protein
MPIIFPLPSLLRHIICDAAKNRFHRFLVINESVLRRSYKTNLSQETQVRGVHLGIRSIEKGTGWRPPPGHPNPGKAGVGVKRCLRTLTQSVSLRCEPSPGATARPADAPKGTPVPAGLSPRANKNQIDSADPFHGISGEGHTITLRALSSISDFVAGDRRLQFVAWTAATTSRKFADRDLCTA